MYDPEEESYGETVKKTDRHAVLGDGDCRDTDSCIRCGGGGFLRRI